ncbi:MAG: hypothetical protein N2578_07215, partial [Bdellovibrionaceae bacterium]|nr:hypothetical protein [Pseudobdellovibrionaceae bacterium]
LNTLQVGTMMMGTLNVAQVEALMGGVRLVLAFEMVVTDPNADGIIDRLNGNMYFLQGPGLGHQVSCGNVPVWLL